LVTSDEEESQSVNVGQEALGKGEGLSHQARYALAQGEVEPFNVVGLALFLGAGLVLLWGHHL